MCSTTSYCEPSSINEYRSEQTNPATLTSSSGRWPTSTSKRCSVGWAVSHVTVFASCRGRRCMWGSIPISRARCNKNGEISAACRTQWLTEAMPLLRRYVTVLVTICGAFAAATTSAAANPVGVPVPPGGSVVAWGDNSLEQLDIPPPPVGVRYTAIAAGQEHSLALGSDGQVVAVGRNLAGETNVPALPAGVTYTAVAGGNYHSLALRSDGRVEGFGRDESGETTVPTLPTGIRYTAIAAGQGHSLALRSDGWVEGFGRNEAGQTDVPPLPAGLTYTAIAAGGANSLALRSDGQVILFSDAALPPSTPPGVCARTCAPVTSTVCPPICIDFGRTYTAIAAGFGHSLVLRWDGRIFGIGSNGVGQLDVPPLPVGVTYTAVAAGIFHSLALRSDGQVVYFGRFPEQNAVPPPLFGARYTAIAAGHQHSLAIMTCDLLCNLNLGLPDFLKNLCPDPIRDQWPCGPGPLIPNPILPWELPRPN
ncbi:RCC1 domain-containing protein [Nocardia sp. GCM10030253]|uniref:RCC1 domain-containing protein n=1 Tax=Nocardia sp. GCM10030253 TaxID=3273404 RepID=UPI00363CCD5A